MFARPCNYDASALFWQVPEDLETEKIEVARAVSIEAVRQPPCHYAEYYFSFDAGVLFAFLVFGDIFLKLGLMAHIS